jgi:hypothetical protein
VQAYMSPCGPQNDSECAKNKTTTPTRNQTLLQDVSLHEVTTSLLITLQSHCQARFLNVISYPHVTPHVPWDGCYCYWFILTCRQCGAVVAMALWVDVYSSLRNSTHYWPTLDHWCQLGVRIPPGIRENILHRSKLNTATSWTLNQL